MALVNCCQGDFLLQVFVGVAIGAVGLSPQVDGLAGHQILNDVAAAVFELPGINLIQRIFLTGLGGADIDIHRGDAAIRRHTVEPCPGGLDGGLGMAEIDERARGAHGGKGPGGHYIHGAGRFHLAFAPDDIDYFFGGNHHRLTSLNFIINFLVGFIHLIVGHNLPFHGERSQIMEQNLISPAGSFLITSLISLFIIIDPIGNIFPYLALSTAYTPAAARSLAWQACLYAFLILALVVVVGTHHPGVSRYYYPGLSNRRRPYPLPHRH